MAIQTSIEGVTSKRTLRAGAVEFLAVMLFVFIGTGTVVSVGGAGTAAGVVAIALAHGLAIMLLVATTARMSGGHINPAVSFAAWLMGKINLGTLVIYVVFQLGGALAGSALVKAVWATAAFDAVSGGAHGIGIAHNAGAGFLGEIVLTFLLVGVIVFVAMLGKGIAAYAPAAIGLAALVDHLAGIGITGASMNPARSFGPAVVAGAWTDHWVYWAGPLAGAALVVVVIKLLFEKAETTD